MGYFTFTLANDPNRVLDYGETGYVICPDDSYIEEPFYDGYGIFGNSDIYELVVDWNKDYLEDIIKYIRRQKNGNFWGQELVPVMLAYQKDDAELLYRTLKTLKKDSKLEYIMGDNEWKRSIGIAIACEFNEVLPFPIKIVDEEAFEEGWMYDELSASDVTQ